jgi:glycosyltransferase involved in cell wall biosynthesis
VKPLRVCLNARFGSGVHGGIEQVIIGLAAGLSALGDGDEQYFFLTDPASEDWLRPYVNGPCRLLHRGERPRDRRLVHRAQRAVDWWAPVARRRWWQRRWPPPTEGFEDGLRPRGDGLPGLEASDGTVELAGIDVVHFPFQSGFLTRLPTIYQPHDLQHLHFPELFSEGEGESRELRYRTYCERADLAVMMTSWGRRDLIEHYGLPEAKVAVVNWGSVVEAYPEPSAADLARTRERLALPEDFVLYPAQAWPHKNHMELLEALALVRDRDGVAIPAVCPGAKNEFFGAVVERARSLGMEGQVTFPGFVSPLELGALYSMAHMLVFPSRFEGWGMPVTEAFAAGVPVASSSTRKSRRRSPTRCFGSGATPSSAGSWRNEGAGERRCSASRTR